jgi:heme/copper-type cytochrome/quinol oxidase subunit 2
MPMTLMRLTARVGIVAFLGALGLVAIQDRRPVATVSQNRPVSMLRDWTIRASSCAFSPNLLEAWQGDRVRITLVSEDNRYSFVLDEYRVSKQFAPGHDAVVEFLADRTGAFAFYNSLTYDNRCSGMRGELIVH